MRPLQPRHGLSTHAPEAVTSGARVAVSSRRPTDVAARRRGIPTPPADRLAAPIGGIEDGKRGIGGALADAPGAPA